MVPLRAARTYLSSPVARESAAISSKKVPPPAVAVMVVSLAGTPWRRLTDPYGMPVGVRKALSRRSPRSVASGKRAP